MYLGVVPDVVIWMVNWLHYLNYEAITRSSSTCNYYIQETFLVHTISYHGLCNGIPHIVPVFSPLSERILV